MAFIRITSITTGAKGTRLHSPRHPEAGSYITSDMAYESGLLKYSSWLYSLDVNDTCIIPTKKIDEIRKNLDGIATFEVERPKYLTHQVGTDRYPYEIIEWKSPTCIVARELDPDEFDSWEEGTCKKYKVNENNPLITLREHKNGGFYEAGDKHCPYYLCEQPRYYRDPCF